MSCNANQYVFQVGGVACMPVSFKDENGAPVNPDAAPTVQWMSVNGAGVDETNAAFGITFDQVQDDTPAAVTGEYQLCYDPSQFNPGDIVEFGVQGVVNGVTLNGRKTSLIKDDPNSRPNIC